MNRSLPTLMIGVASLELISLPFFFAMKKEIVKNRFPGIILILAADSRVL